MLEVRLQHINKSTKYQQINIGDNCIPTVWADTVCNSLDVRQVGARPTPPWITIRLSGCGTITTHSRPKMELWLILMCLYGWKVHLYLWTHPTWPKKALRTSPTWGYLKLGGGPSCGYLPLQHPREGKVEGKVLRVAPHSGEWVQVLNDHWTTCQFWRGRLPLIPV